MKKVILFYKRLIEPGGAERLLIEEYKELKNLGYHVTVMSQRISGNDFFSEIDSEDKVILGENFFSSLFKATSFFLSNRGSIIIAASGHIEIFLYTLFSTDNYFLKIHHPSFMSFNEYDKYSVFQIKHFDDMTKLNFGAQRFKKMREMLSLSEKLYINLRAILSILAVRRSKEIFVLSEYARNEKKVLFNVDSFIVKGALKSSAIGQKNQKLDRFREFSPIILTIARLDINKRIDVLIEAFSIVLNEFPDAVLVIGGTGEELDNLRKKAKNEMAENSIFFQGFIDDGDLSKYYSMADLFVSIDWADYRITTYEALANHTRVINSIETDKDRFLEENGFLKLVMPNKTETADAIIQMIRDDNALDYDGLDKYLERYTWRKYTKQILEVISNSNT